MKRIGVLYERAFTREALLAAFHAAARHKHGKRACFNFEKRLASNLDELFQELSAGTYRPRPYYSFMVYEPKPRRIFAPSFADLVVQHAIYRVILPIFNPTFIDQSFACRPGKGTHRAADYAQRALQASNKDSVTLKLDIRKFFYSINRQVLRRLIERKIKDKRFVDLMMQFAEYGEPVGIPIGNLLSQVYALIYLSPVDHFIKRTLKSELYCRYVDDFILFDVQQTEANSKIQVITEFLRNQLGLELSRYTIASRSRGVNFVGYRTWAGKRFIRKHSLFKFKRAAAAKEAEAIASFLGHARNTSSLRHLLATLKEYANDLPLPKAYRSDAHRRACFAVT
jgi:retron-type reverse transcriptase